MPAVEHRLLITYSSELVDGAPLYVLSNSPPLPWARKEPAGRLFHEAVLRKLGFGKNDVVDDTSVPEKKEKVGTPSVESYHFKGKRKTCDGDQQDHYALLGLSHLRFLATEEQIRKSYRDVALKHHPDKQASQLLHETVDAREAKKEEIDRHFKAIQEAYEVLIDPTKRRLYDSTDEFDDEIPSECSQEDFFNIFGPVFLRNGRWSVVQPVPSLGEECTSIADVDVFYDFWWSFKSWREFPHADEFDLEQAESREHKRWMERQNGKLREKAKKEENVRIRTLIDNAYRRDPRILRRKEEEKAEKVRKKQARVLAKQEKELEAARLFEEERLRKVEEDRKSALQAAAQKKVREKEKKILRKERQRLRAVTAAVIAREDLCISDDAVESLCTSLEMLGMTSLCEKLERCKGLDEQADILRSALRGIEQRELCPDQSNGFSVDRPEQVKKYPDSAISGSRPKASSGLQDGGACDRLRCPVELAEHGKATSFALNDSEKKEKPWIKEEVELLRKAVVKYPKGTSQRWEVVSNYIGTGRSIDEILRAIKTVLSLKPDSSKAFDSFLSCRNSAKDLASTLTSSEDVPDCGAITTTATPFVMSNGNVDGSRFDRKDKSIWAANALSSEGEDSLVEKKRSSVPQAHVNGSVAATPNGNVEQEVWSEMQELALVKALKIFPKDTAQRWDRIAAAVPGKTKIQCFKKFAELRDIFRSKRVL